MADNPTLINFRLNNINTTRRIKLLKSQKRAVNNSTHPANASFEI